MQPSAPMVEGPHCQTCKHRRACVLPQRETGQVCGWYNAQVGKVVKREKPKHKLLALTGQTPVPEEPKGKAG